MFRFRLILVILVQFSFVLLLGTALYLGSIQVNEYFQRSKNAYETFSHYENLSEQAYRYFKQRFDRFIINKPSTEADDQLAKQRLDQVMVGLKEAVIKNTDGFFKAEDLQDKPQQLDKVARLAAFLDASDYRFNEIARLHQQGKIDSAVKALSLFSDQEIDLKFRPLIDSATHAEQSKANQLQADLQALIQKWQWFAVIVSILAALFSLISGILLIRSVKQPIEALMQGTDQIASGNLEHRIGIDGYDEFSYLARHFNQMAQELELQQAKLRDARAILEKRIEERTAKLHQLNTELKRMDANRQALLADISHELRTPITVIRGEAEVVLRGQDRHIDEYKDSLHRIAELAVQLAKYVSDLLFMARAETQNLQFDLFEMDLNALMLNVLEDFRMLTADKNLNVSYTGPDKAVPVLGDFQRLRQVLFILGDNACRYSRDGGTIHLALYVTAESVNFSVADQGIGIPAQDLPRIFERHFRSKNALDLRIDGSGLGLPMANTIIQAHGGNISVNSIENSGSTFTVSLPTISK